MASILGAAVQVRVECLPGSEAVAPGRGEAAMAELVPPNLVLFMQSLVNLGAERVILQCVGQVVMGSCGAPVLEFLDEEVLDARISPHLAKDCGELGGRCCAYVCHRSVWAMEEMVIHFVQFTRTSLRVTTDTSRKTNT